MGLLGIDLPPFDLRPAATVPPTLSPHDPRQKESLFSESYGSHLSTLKEKNEEKWDFSVLTLW